MQPWTTSDLPSSLASRIDTNGGIPTAPHTPVDGECWTFDGWRNSAGYPYVNPDDFYSGSGLAVARALEACDSCPMAVRAACLRDAERETTELGGTWGIRAGLTPSSRQRVATEGGAPAGDRQCSRCGSALIRRDDETASNFAKRSTCGRVCRTNSVTFWKQRINDVTHIALSGNTATEAATAFGIQPDSLRAALYRHGHGDVWRRLVENEKGRAA